MKIKHLLLTAIMLVFCVNLYAQSSELEEYNKAIELDSTNAEAYYNRGIIYKLLAKDRNRNLDKKKKAEYKALEEKDRKKYQELTKES
ncbi:MAG: tetratricopeptide repeat protein [Bacteroidales bacterium]|nr:tetratricopeptide repeat protein [Bacteroidales bacterium]